MDNPNVSSGTPLKCLQTVPDMAVPVTSGLGTSPKGVTTPYTMSNAASVQSAPHSFGSGPPDMRPTGSIPSFEKLQPKYAPTSPGPMGIDYKP